MKEFARRFFRLACLFALPGAAATGQPAPAPPAAAPRRPLSVGFLPEGSDIINAPILMERLRSDLLGQAKVAAALAEAGFAPDDIALSPCDGPRDMAQRMSSDEFDIVFPTAVVFARQTGKYGEPILMSSLPGDFKQPRDGGVLRRGVVFAGPASPLFRAPASDDPAAFKAALASAPLAVPSSDSAAGFIYPTLKLMQDYGLSGPAQYWFCESDAEAVKNVVAGMAQIGACREGELDALLPKGTEGKYYRILFRTDQFPTDPIVLRATLAPEFSPLGRELKVALRDFFKRAGTASGSGLAYENAAARSYEKIVRDLRLFDGGRLRSLPAAVSTPMPVLPAATPIPSPAPTATPAPVRPAMPGMIGSGP